jgi:translation initiation factor IF-1
MKKIMFPLLSGVIALSLTGCWTPPNANVQPKGEPRLIQSGIPVESVKDHVTVEFVDATQRVINLKLSDGTTVSCKVAGKVSNLEKIQSGDPVKVTLAEELAVYVLRDGKLGDQSIPFNAKVQKVDPSYRLLTLQYPGGQTEELKPGLDTKLLAMAPGDDVAVKVIEVKAIHIEKP